MPKDTYKEINANRKICNEEIYDEIAEEEDLSPQLVKEILTAHSSFTITIVKIGAFESVIFPYLGKVKAKLRAIKHITNMMFRKHEEKQNENRVV